MKKKKKGERSHVDMRHHEHSRVLVVFAGKMMVLLLPAATSSLRIPFVLYCEEISQSIRTNLRMNGMLFSE